MEHEEGGLPMSSITPYQVQALTSVKQALNISMLRKVMNQDATSVESVVKAMEQSVSPHKGQSIDIKV